MSCKVGTIRDERNRKGERSTGYLGDFTNNLLLCSGDAHGCLMIESPFQGLTSELLIFSRDLAEKEWWGKKNMWTSFSLASMNGCLNKVSLIYIRFVTRASRVRGVLRISLFTLLLQLLSQFSSTPLALN